MQPNHQSNECSEPVASPMAMLVTIDAGIRFSVRDRGTGTHYVAEDTRRGKYFRFGSQEYHVVNLLSGERSLSEIHRILVDDGLDWSENDLVFFVRHLMNHGLVTVASTAQRPGPGSLPSNGGHANVAESATHRRVTKPALRLISGLLSQRIPLANGDRLAKRFLPLLGFLFTPTAQILSFGLVVAAIALVWSNWVAFSMEIRRVFDQPLWLLLGLIWCFLKLVHETGHAVCAKRHGVRVGPMGVIFFLCAPLAYVDVTDAWKLPQRRDRIQIALAGVSLELLVGAIAAWIWWLSPLGSVKHLAAQVFLLAGPATLLVNANPLLRLDGYYVVSDLLEIPNLRTLGRQRLGAWIDHGLIGLPIPPRPLQDWRTDFAVVHATLSVVFQFTWMTGLVVAVWSWAKALGMVLAIAAILMWAIYPAMKWGHRIWTLQPAGRWVLNPYQRRLVAWIMMALLLCQLAAIHSSPFQRRIPVLVRYQNEQIARAAVDSFVTAVYFKCGERVERGQLLIQLEQPELIIEHDQLMDQRDAAIGRSIQHRRLGEIALSEASSDEAASLQRRIDEIGEQIDQLQVVAQRSGKITTPSTDRLLGRYVQRGDELLRVSDPQEKEVLALIAEDNLNAYSQANRQKVSAKIRFRGGVRVEAALSSPEPSASRRLPHPALAATAGGPLAVQHLETTETVELVQPHLQTVLPLDPLTSLQVQSGQIGRLTLPDNRSLFARLWEHLRSS